MSERAYPNDSLYEKEVKVSDYPVVEKSLLKYAGKLPDAKILLRNGLHSLYSPGDNVVKMNRELGEVLSQDHFNFCLFHELWHALGHDDEDPKSGSVVMSERFSEDNNLPVNLRQEILNYFEVIRQIRHNLTQLVKSNKILNVVFEVSNSLGQGLTLKGSSLIRLLYPFEYDSFEFSSNEGFSSEFLSKLGKELDVKINPLKYDSISNIYYHEVLTEKDNRELKIKFSIITSDSFDLDCLTIDTLEYDGENIVDRCGGLSSISKDLELKPSRNYVKVLEDRDCLTSELSDELSKVFVDVNAFLEIFPSAKVTKELEDILSIQKSLADRFLSEFEGETITLYHGTSDVFLPGILKEGIKCTKSLGLPQARKHGHDWIYLTSSRPYAMSYSFHSQRQQGGKPVVLVFELPLTELYETKLMTGSLSLESLWRDKFYYNEKANSSKFGEIKDLSFTDTEYIFKFNSRFTPKTSKKEVLKGFIPVSYSGQMPVDEFTCFRHIPEKYLSGIDYIDQEEWRKSCELAKKGL